MTEDTNELEWRRHLLSALDTVSKRIEENSSEHVLIRAEIAAVKVDVAAFKSDIDVVKKQNPNAELEKYVTSSRGWRMVIVGQLITILALIFSAVWWGGTLNERVFQLRENQVKVINEVKDLSKDMTVLKTVSIGYNNYMTSQKDSRK